MAFILYRIKHMPTPRIHNSMPHNQTRRNLSLVLCQLKLLLPHRTRKLHSFYRLITRLLGLRLLKSSSDSQCVRSEDPNLM